jgi:hypothetical protein
LKATKANGFTGVVFRFLFFKEPVHKCVASYSTAVDGKRLERTGIERGNSPVLARLGEQLSKRGQRAREVRSENLNRVAKRWRQGSDPVHRVFKLSLVDAAGWLFANDEYGEPIRVWIIVGSALAAKEQHSGLLLSGVLLFVRFILVMEQDKRLFFRLPGEPGGVVEITFILSRLLDGFRIPVETEGEMRVQRIGKRCDDEL